MEVTTGKLRHLVTIQTRSTTRDVTSGQLEESWTNGDTVWAAVLPMSGRELEQAQAIHAQVKTKIVMRYTSNVSAESRIKFGDRTFHVWSVINTEERNIETICYCEEVV